MKIGKNPISQNLALLLGHDKKSKSDFLKTLQDLHSEIEKKYQGEGKNKAQIGSLKAYITGRRTPQFHTIRQIAEVYSVDPYDLCVNQEKFIEKSKSIPREGIEKRKIAIIDKVLEKDIIQEEQEDIINNTLELMNKEFLGLVLESLGVYIRHDQNPLLLNKKEEGF